LRQHQLQLATVGEHPSGAARGSKVKGPQDLAPNIFQILKNKNKSLNEALHNTAWIRDIDLQHAGFTSQHFVEYVQLWHALNHLQLQSDREDNIIWNFVPDGKFTTGSAYHVQFIGATMTNFKQLI